MSMEIRGDTPEYSQPQGLSELLCTNLRPVNGVREAVWPSRNGKISVTWIPRGNTCCAYLPESAATTLTEPVLDTLRYVDEGQETPEIDNVFREYSTDDKGAFWRVANGHIIRLSNISQPEQVLSIVPDYHILSWSRSLNKAAGGEGSQGGKKSRLPKAIAMLSFIAIVAGLVWSSSEATAPEQLAAYSTPIDPATTATPEAVPSSTPTSGQTSTPEVKAIESDLKIAGWNVLINVKPKETAKSVEEIMKTYDVALLQETTSVGKDLGKIACGKTSCKYDMFPDANAGSKGKTRIMWSKNRFTLQESHSLHAASDPDAHQHLTHKRYITWVRLKDNQTGQDFWFVDAHAPNNVEKDGLPNNRKTAVKEYIRYMKRLVTIIKELKSQNLPIVLEGDFNGDFRKCKVSPFPRGNLDHIMNDIWNQANISGKNAKLSTTGNKGRIIDYMYYSETGLVKIDITKIEVGTNNGNMSGGDEKSDHKPIKGIFHIAINQ